MTFNLGRVEAEALSASGAYGITSRGDASNGQIVQTQSDDDGNTVETGNLEGQYVGPPAQVQFDVGFLNEGDGASTITVFVNEVAAGSFTGDGGSGRGVLDLRSLTLDLRPGDVVRVQGESDQGENARIDFFDLTEIGSLANAVTIAATGDGAEPAQNGQFTVSLDEAAATDTLVSYSVAGTATPGSDFAALSGSSTILAGGGDRVTMTRWWRPTRYGQTSAVIDVTVLDDALVEADETVVVTLQSASGDADVALGSTTEATVQITSDEVTNAVTIAATGDGAEPAQNGQFTVSLETVAATDTLVSYSVAGTATPGSDFAALSGSVTILAGQTSAVIDVTVLDDALVEADETVALTLQSASGDANIVLGTTTDATLTLTSDEIPDTSFAGETRAISADIEAGTYSFAARVLPYGDSLTHGVTANTPKNSVARELAEGYREDLFEGFLDAGVFIDFVGRRQNGPERMLDPDHSGYPGRRLSDTLSNNQGLNFDFDSTVEELTPDVTLFLQGTNDIFRDFSAQGIADILDDIETAIEQFYAVAGNDDAYLVVTTLPPLLIISDQTAVDTLNQGIRDLVADLTNPATSTLNPVPTTLLLFENPTTVADIDTDGIHLTPEAYGRFASDLQQFLETNVGVSGPWRYSWRRRKHACQRRRNCRRSGRRLSGR